MPPALIGIAEFVEETRDDYNSPTTSTFASRMPDCRQTISVLEEVCRAVNFIHNMCKKGYQRSSKTENDGVNTQNRN